MRAKKKSEIKIHDLNLQLEYGNDKKEKYCDKIDLVENDINNFSKNLDQIKNNVFSYAKMSANRNNNSTK